jgi:ribose/xylose/arabinose/galactoside ABC-type transport system permease subunit
MKKILTGRKNPKEILLDNILVLFLLAMCVLLSIIEPLFLTPGNLINVLIQISINALIATGMTFVILTGGIDLSVGSVAAFAGVLSAYFVKKYCAQGSLFSIVLIVIAVCVFSGAAVGGLNGFCISKLNVTPFIATLGTYSIARGFAYIVSNGRPIFSLPEKFKWIGQYRLGGEFPIIIILMVVVLGIAEFILDNTPYGRHVLSVGSNRQVSYLCGVDQQKVTRSVYYISSALSALGGVVLASKLGTGQPNAAEGYELNAIAAVVLGGTSMNGGKGSIGKTIIGIFTIGIINNGMSLLRVNAYWQKVVMGTIIVLAVVLDQYRLRSE